MYIECMFEYTYSQHQGRYLNIECVVKVSIIIQNCACKSISFGSVDEILNRIFECDEKILEDGFQVSSTSHLDLVILFL